MGSSASLVAFIADMRVFGKFFKIAKTFGGLITWFISSQAVYINHVFMLYFNSEYQGVKFVLS